MASNGILIIGSAGFVGTALLNRLSKSDREIFCISTHENREKIFSNVNSYVGFLDDHKILRKVLPRCKFVFYLASHSTPGFSAHKPSVEAESNLLPCLRFLEILEEYEDILLVYLSSGGAVYGNVANDLNPENLPLKPISYYGAGKAAIEKFLLAYHSQTGNKILLLRPSNLYGPGQTIRKGFGIIPNVFNNVLERKPITIWGNGRMVRDYLHINDFLNLCDNIIQKIPSLDNRRRIYNVGSGQGVQLDNLINLIEDITGTRIVKVYKNPRGVDVDKNILDCSRIEKDFSWNAEYSLEEGLTETWQWFRRMCS